MFVTVYKKIEHNVGPTKKIFFCTYTFVGISTLSSPSFKAAVSTVVDTCALTVPFRRLI